MKSLFLTILASLVMFGCAGKDGSNGKNGAVGTPGFADNGHSVVGNSRAATALECTETDGTAVDFYVDMDDSLNYSSGDILQAGIVACNGSNGEDGDDGEDGLPGAAGSSAIMTSYPLVASNTCINIHTGLYAVRINNYDVALYTDPSCTVQVDTVNNVILRADINEIYVFGAKVLLVLEGTSSNMSIRKLVYQ